MKKTLVRDWMTKEAIKGSPHMRLHDALRVMNKANIRALPVIEEEQLVGIVTKRDLLRADVTTVMKNPWEQYRQVGSLSLEKLMSKSVITIKSDAPVARAAQILEENTITALPVVDDGRNLKGILTSTDLLQMLIEEYPTLREEIAVESIMSRMLTTVNPNTILLDAQRLMAVKRIRTLPVLENGVLVGIITRTDLLSAAPAAGTGEGQYEITKQILTTPVRFLMTSSPITIRENVPVPEAARLMIEHKIHSLPVMDAKERLMGIVTETDLFRFIVVKFLI